MMARKNRWITSLFIAVESLYFDICFSLIGIIWVQPSNVKAMLVALGRSMNK